MDVGMAGEVGEEEVGHGQDRAKELACSASHGMDFRCGCVAGEDNMQSGAAVKSRGRRACSFVCCGARDAVNHLSLLWKNPRRRGVGRLLARVRGC
jgi:hypothetical protein